MFLLKHLVCLFQSFRGSYQCQDERIQFSELQKQLSLGSEWQFGGNLGAITIQYETFNNNN